MFVHIARNIEDKTYSTHKLIVHRYTKQAKREAAFTVLCKRYTP